MNDKIVVDRKEKSEVIREAVVSLLIQKFPDGLSDDEIIDFTRKCYHAMKIAFTVAPDGSIKKSPQ